MFIKQVIVKGFKSYGNKIVFGPFSSGKNAIVGLNGSGKSNFYTAISFVLLDDYSRLQQSDKKSLLYEGKGESAKTAYVEIIFDNSKRKIPIDTNEVSIKRVISVKKDGYYINGKNATRHDVNNVLESCEFTPSNGYYIVRQGRVNTLALMKDKDRLDLLLEISGAKYYDKQKDNSIKTLNESNEKIEKIKSSICYFDERLSQLENEMRELKDCEKTEKEIKGVQIVLKNREFEEITFRVEIELKEREKFKKDIDEIKLQIDELAKISTKEQKKLDDMVSEEKKLNTEKDLIDDKILKSNCIKKTLNFSYQECLLKFENSKNLINELQKKLESLNSSIEQSENEYNIINEKYLSNLREKNFIEQKIELINNIFNGNMQSYDEVENELKIAKEINEKISNDKQLLRGKIVNHENEINNLENIQKQKEIEFIRLSKEQEENKIRKNANECKKKELLEKKNQIMKDLKKTQKEEDFLKTKITKLMPKDVGIAINALQGLNIKGVYKPIFKLISCDENLSKAVLVSGKTRLFNYVVENDDVATSIVEYLMKHKLGRITLIPLNTIKSINKSYPKEIVLLMSMLNYDKKFHKAISNIFGRIAFAETIQEAIQVTNKYNIDCVTRDGDYISAKGLLSGGSQKAKNNLFSISLEIENNDKIKSEIQHNLQCIKDEVDSTIKKIQNNLDFKQEIEYKIQNICEDKKVVEINIKEKKKEIEVFTKEVQSLIQQIENGKQYISTLEDKLNFLNKRASNNEVQQNEMHVLLNEKERTQAINKELYSKKLELRKLLDTNLLPRRKIVIEEINNTNVDVNEKELKNRKDKIIEEDNKILEFTSIAQELNKKIICLRENIDANEKKIEEIKEKTKIKDQELKKISKQLENVITEIFFAQEEKENVKIALRDIGTIPTKYVNRKANLSISSLRNELTQLTKKKQKYISVNKRAITQYNSFKSKRDDLIIKKEELLKSRESIQDLIVKLDKKKEESIIEAFESISNNFSNIFSQIEPNGKGKLVLEKENSDFKCISIRVKFNEYPEITSLFQLSGGQKVLVALSMIFAIQKYSAAPFYLFDEVDSALDEKYRIAISKLMDEYCNPNNNEHSQIILTTFKKEFLQGCNKFFTVKYNKDFSDSYEITGSEAESILIEQSAEN